MEDLNRKLRKISDVAFAALFICSVIWFATLAARHYCTWGFQGFTTYSLLSYLFLVIVHGFLDNALDQESGSHAEELS